MKIAIPLPAIVFALAALFYPIQNSTDQFGRLFTSYDRLNGNVNYSMPFQTNMVSLDSLPACQQNAFHSSGNSEQKLFQQEACDCIAPWLLSYQLRLNEENCRTIEGCIEARIEITEPFTLDSDYPTCRGGYEDIYIYSDGEEKRPMSDDAIIRLSEAEGMCQDLYGTQIIDTPIPEFPNQPNPDPYIDPDPYNDPDSNPYPNPDPGPISIDQETLRILQSILSTPVIPITGAVAGGLIAWVISMLGGGRTVLPPAPRPPTGGVRPGQAGPDGKVWSPSQGWVTKSTYDYQQKWLQKGWQLNSQTGKLEVQPGAINEKGEVWYKLPHEMDEGDSYYWVDKAKVQECERNLAEGKVWDRNMDWQAPDDLKRIQSDKDAIRQRSREFNAKKNAEIQKAVQDASQKRQEEYQDWLKKYEQKEQMPVKLTNLNADLDTIDQDLTKQNIYVTNKLQGDPTLIFQGLEVLTNGVWDSTIGNFTGSQGLTCGNYVEETINPVTEAVKKQFPGAKVQQVVFEEKSTKNPSGFFGTLDSWNTENHTLIKVTLPDGTELAVDFHQHNASNVLENPPLVQPYDKARKPWKKYLGEDFMETIY